MTKNIQKILKPFLIISYVFGLKIDNLSNLRVWFSVLYMLVVWSIYYFLSTSSVVSSFNKIHPIEDSICYWLETFTTLLSIIFSIYHDKKFQNCLKKLDFVDNTLLKLGVKTDYDKIRKKTVWFVLGWFIIVILTNCCTALYVKNERNFHFATALFLIFLRNYCFHINFIGDLTATTILEYIGLKFDQINEYFNQNLMKTDKHKIKRAWENVTIHPYQHRLSKPLSNKCVTWIVIHLHLELRKISCEIDSIFGTQMTIKMACYFGWLAIDLREIFNAILINNYVKSITMAIIFHLFWVSHNVFKFLLINYMCETVSIKASVTADLLNRLSHLTCDVEIREIISQFLLQIIYAPLRFCGIGFFQFGFKFLRTFITSIATVLVIIIQAHTNK